MDGWKILRDFPAIHAMAGEYSGDAGFFTRSLKIKFFLENGIIGTEFV
jgi:hypothetical protein